MKDKKRRTYGFLTGLLLILSVCLTSCGNQGQTDSGKDSNTQSGTKVAAEDHSAEEKGSDSESYVTVDDVPAYSGEPYVEVNDNQPELRKKSLRQYPMRITANWMSLEDVSRQKRASDRS